LWLRASGEDDTCERFSGFDSARCYAVCIAALAKVIFEEVCISRVGLEARICTVADDWHKTVEKIEGNVEEHSEDKEPWKVATTGSMDDHEGEDCVKNVAGARNEANEGGDANTEWATAKHVVEAVGAALDFAEDKDVGVAAADWWRILIGFVEFSVGIIAVLALADTGRC